MADSAAFEPVRRNSDHIPVAARTNEPSADAQASRPRSAGGLLRSSQVPVPDETTSRTGSATPAGDRAHHQRQRLRLSGAPTGAALPLARPSTVPARPIQDVLHSPGQPLAAPLQEEMEARLGADFHDVRIHTGPAAQRSAAEIGARAFTSGHHVAIAEKDADKHTLAHELTHVIQQRSGPVAGTDNGSGLRISDPSDDFERAAESNAHRVMSSDGMRTHVPHGQSAAQRELNVTSDVVQRTPIGTGGHQYTAGYPSETFRSDHIARDKAGAEEATMNRANDGRGLVNTVIIQSYPEVKALVLGAEYNHAAHLYGNVYRVPIYCRHIVVIALAGENEIRIKETKDETVGTVWVKVYFDEFNKRISITGVWGQNSA